MRNGRFVLGSTTDMKTKLELQSTELESDVSDLKKKLHYLETTAKNSKEHIDQLLRSGGRA
jgi:prefoldin subunit 1